MSPESSPSVRSFDPSLDEKTAEQIAALIVLDCSRGAKSFSELRARCLARGVDLSDALGLWGNEK